MKIRSGIRLNRESDRAIKRYQTKHCLPTYADALNQMIREFTEYESEKSIGVSLGRLADVLAQSADRISSPAVSVAQGDQGHPCDCVSLNRRRDAEDEDSFGYKDKSMMYLLRKIATDTDRCSQIADELLGCKETVDRIDRQFRIQRAVGCHE